MWEQVDELGRFAAVGDKEQCVVLGFVSASSHSVDEHYFLAEVFNMVIYLHLAHLPNHHVRLRKRA